MATHDGQKVSAVKASKLDDVYDAAKDYDVIGVDEGQFVSLILCKFIYALRTSLKTCWNSARTWRTAERQL